MGSVLMLLTSFIMVEIQLRVCTAMKCLRLLLRFLTFFHVVFPRLHFLFECLVSPIAVEEAKAQTSTKNGKMNFVDVIGRTIARLLGFLQDFTLRQEFIGQLIQIVLDISLLITSRKIDSFPEGLDIVIFDEEIAVDIAMMPAGTEHSIRVRDQTTLIVLQGALFFAIHYLVDMLRDRRCKGVVQEGFELFAEVDLSTCGLHESDRRDLFDAVEQALSYEAGNNSDSDDAVVSYRTRQAALRVLSSMSTDCRKSEGAHESAFNFELTLLVAQVSVNHLKKESPEEAVRRQEASFTRKLASCLGEIALSLRASHTQLAVLSMLVDSIHLIEAPDGNCKCHVELAVLRSVYVLLISLDISSLSIDFAVDQRDVLKLFRLLNRPILHEPSLWILSEFFRIFIAAHKRSEVYRVALQVTDFEGQPESPKKRRDGGSVELKPRKRSRPSESNSCTEYVLNGTLPTADTRQCTSSWMSETLSGYFSATLKSGSPKRVVPALRLLLVLIDNVPVEEEGLQVSSRLLACLCGMIGDFGTVIRGSQDHELLHCFLSCGIQLSQQVEGTVGRAGAFVDSFLVTCKSLLGTLAEFQSSDLFVDLPHFVAETCFFFRSWRMRMKKMPTIQGPISMRFPLLYGTVRVWYDGVTIAGQWVAYESLVSSTSSHNFRLVLLGQGLMNDGFSLAQRTLDAISQADVASMSPRVRLANWQCIAWLLHTCDPQELRSMFFSSSVEGEQRITADDFIGRLLDTVFNDRDTDVMRIASSELCAVFDSSSWSRVVALLCSDSQWQVLHSPTDVLPMCEKLPMFESVISRWFEEIDRRLQKVSEVLHLQLSSDPVGSPPCRMGERECQGGLLVFFHSAARSLLSSCKVSQNIFGKRMAEDSFVRIMKLVVGDGKRRREQNWICTAAMSQVGLHTNFSEAIKQEETERFFPMLFRESLLPSTSQLVAECCGIRNIDTRTRATLCSLLLVISQRFFLDPFSEKGKCVPKSDTSGLERQLDAVLPGVLAQLTLEKDYDTMLLVTNYKLFILGLSSFDSRRRARLRSSARGEQEIDLPVGAFRSEFLNSPHVSRSWDLEEQTGSLCFAANMLDRILPLLLAKANLTELLFFTKTVLRGRNTFRETVGARDRQVLKSIIWEGCRSTAAMEKTLRALKIVAAALTEDLDADVGIRSLDDVLERPVLIVKKWVTGHFMYLIVSLVQLNWNHRALADKLRAMRCLNFMLSIVQPSDAAQYFPQILATFNTAVSVRSGERDDQVLLLAVQALDKYVRLVAAESVDIMCENLQVVVVSLIPVVILDGGDKTYCRSLSADLAIALLEWLAEGDIGKRLAGSFSVIPFLPSSPVFGRMKASLRALGVDFDSVITTQGTQETKGRSSIASGASSVETTSSTITNTQRQQVLSSRIGILRTMLKNENSGIRKVSLDHLTKILRANRDVFRALLDNEGDTSMKHYLTVARPGTLGT